MRNIRSARFDSDVRRHETKASRAVSTAWSTSSTLAKSTSCVCSPVAGLNTGPVRPLSPGTSFPPIQWLRRSIAINSHRRQGFGPAVDS